MTIGRLMAGRLGLDKAQGSALKPARRPIGPLRGPILDLRLRARPLAICPLVGEREGADRDLSWSVSAPSRSPTKMNGSKGHCPWRGSKGQRPLVGVPGVKPRRLTPRPRMTRHAR